MTRMTYREALRSAMRDALKQDPRVFLMGEDVGLYGGAFAVSHGLIQEFGPERVRDTPLSESTFVGAGIGAALNGMRPIVEVMTVNFSMLAMDQVLNNAATLRYMSGGQFHVPLVVRMATGGGRQLGAQHSHSLEGWYAHIPGIRVLAPATVADARGMLLAALQQLDPVFIFEHATLYPVEDDIDEHAGPADIDHAVVRRAGSDVTLVTYGGSLGKTLTAAADARRGGHRGGGDRPPHAPSARHNDRSGVRRAHAPRRGRRRGVAHWQLRRRGLGADHGARLQRARLARRSRLRRRGARAVREAHGGRRVAPGRHDSADRAGDVRVTWPSS